MRLGQPREALESSFHKTFCQWDVIILIICICHLDNFLKYKIHCITLIDFSFLVLKKKKRVLNDHYRYAHPILI